MLIAGVLIGSGFNKRRNNRRMLVHSYRNVQGGFANSVASLASASIIARFSFTDAAKCRDVFPYSLFASGFFVLTQREKVAASA